MITLMTIMLRYFFAWLSFQTIIYCTKVKYQYQPERLTFNHYSKGPKVIDPNYHHEFTIAVKENGLDFLKSLHTKVSDPRNQEYYGKHISKHEIESITYNKEGIDAVKRFCYENNIEIIREYNQLIKVRVQLNQLEKILQTEFYIYHETQTNHQNDWNNNEIVRCLSYTIPEDLERYIAYIHNLVDIPPPIYGGNPSISSKANNGIISSSTSRGLAVTYGVTPQVLNSFYKITGTASKGNQSVFSTVSESYSNEDLSKFQSFFGLNANPIAHNVNRGPSTSSYCSSSGNCVEASLDVQYMTAVGNGCSTTYWYQTDDKTRFLYSDNLFLDWAYNVSYTNNPPLVHSISYTSTEILVSHTILDLFSTEMIKLGLRGITVIAASGDDGSGGSLFKSKLSLSKCYMYAQFPASNP